MCAKGGLGKIGLQLERRSGRRRTLNFSSGEYFSFKGKIINIQKFLKLDTKVSLTVTKESLRNLEFFQATAKLPLLPECCSRGVAQVRPSA